MRKYDARQIVGWRPFPLLLVLSTGSTEASHSQGVGHNLGTPPPRRPVPRRRDPLPPQGPSWFRPVVLLTLLSEAAIAFGDHEPVSQLLGGVLALAALGIVGEALLSWLLGWRRL